MFVLTESMIKQWLDGGLYTYDSLKETLNLMITDKKNDIEKLRAENNGWGVRSSFISAEIVCLYNSINNYEKALKIFGRDEKMSVEFNVTDLVLSKQKLINFANRLEQVQREAGSSFSSEHQKETAISLLCDINNRLEEMCSDLNKWYWYGRHK